MSTRSTSVSGIDPGQRRLNGPQTSGRTYRNLSIPGFATLKDINIAIPVAEGIELLADIYRPDSDQKFPVLVSASPYPRQLQDVGAPLGFIEAGQSDFFVPRGYVHVIVNVRGTNGSGGEWTLLDKTEWQDLHNVIEWAAAQPWSNGKVGMLGISYFAMTQLAAAVTLPPHLTAIFPLAVSADLYELVFHGGLFSETFISSWTAALSIASTRDDKLLRGPFVEAAREILRNPRIHADLQKLNGEAALSSLQKVMRGHYPSQPWDTIWEDLAIAHSFRDEFWADRGMYDLISKLRIPVYLGCDWDNAPVHLPSTFVSWHQLQQIPESERPPLRMTLLAAHGLTWPWESLHIEALAWYDHWLKQRDTGILDGPPIRYWLPIAEEWRSTEQWPPAESQLTAFTLQANGILAQNGDTSGKRTYLAHGEQLPRPHVAHPPAQPAVLRWMTEPLDQDLDFAGNIELQLDAAITESDTGWLVSLEDIDANGAATFITPGWLRAELRALNEVTSAPGQPVILGTQPQPVPPNEKVRYQIALVPNARRILAGHRLSLTIGSSDNVEGGVPSALGFRHQDIGRTSLNTVFASSELLLPILQVATS